MKVAVSSNGENLDAQIDPRFGRCQSFIAVNPDDLSFEVLNNDSAALGGGAGIQTAQFLASQGVAAVITGNCGPNAVQTLAAAGIELFGGQAGTVREAIERFKKGNLTPTSEANVDSHSGMNVAAGSGRGGGSGSGGGMGMGGCKGTGRGMGGGRGGGCGRGMSDFAGSSRAGSGTQSGDQELEELKQQADSLNKKMKEVISRIHSIENQ
ncbi:NifB/NifX family molybdenum-iron cluster-binding protein [bacterium]|nr:NifB/NifX family molybdenum-iron cluster-binding protein [bacterium]